MTDPASVSVCTKGSEPSYMVKLESALEDTTESALRCSVESDCEVAVSRCPSSIPVSLCPGSFRSGIFLVMRLRDLVRTVGSSDCCLLSSEDLSSFSTGVDVRAGLHSNTIFSNWGLSL